MFDTHQKITGTQYMTTVGLLVGAFIFVPAIVIVSRPLGYMSITLALACNAVCAALAWVYWTKYSQLTIPSLETPRVRSK
jgi:hypothetical protein